MDYMYRELEIYFSIDNIEKTYHFQVSDKRTIGLFSADAVWRCISNMTADLLSLEPQFGCRLHLSICDKCGCVIERI